MSQNLKGEIESKSRGGAAYLGEVGCKPGHEDFETFCKMNGWDVLQLHPSRTAGYFLFQNVFVFFFF